MEFPFSLSFLQADDDHNDICVIDGGFARSLSSEHYKSYTRVIDEMGKASCKAQDLPKPVTASHLLTGSDHIIFVLHDAQHTAKGILKIGRKKLFIHGMNRQYIEMEPLCVLDFYVHEHCQRMGIGRRLFEFMLKMQKTEPRLLAYDAPSPKLLGFLNKHYALKAFLPQNCNYVVFDDYFGATSDYRFEPIKVTPPPMQKKADIHSATEFKELDEIAVTADEPPANVPKEMTVPKDEQKERAVEAQGATEREQKTQEQSREDAFSKQSHQSQMDFIEKQIAQTKLELKASDAKIHRHHLDEVSPFSESHPMKKAFDMRFRRKKSGFH